MSSTSDMQKYQDYIFSNPSVGLPRPVPNATVLVLNYPALTTATIYSDNGITTTANPFLSAGDGKIAFYAADGRYSIQVSGQGITQGTTNDIELQDANAFETSLSASTGAALVGSTGPSTVQADITARPTSATLAASTGAALVGSTGPSTVQADITARPTSAALAAFSGSGLVGFSHANTYAQGTEGLALQSFINVKNAPYNAVGDGVSDDRAALFAANATGKSLFFPNGTYKVGSALTLTVPCAFDFGATIKPGAAITVTINAPINAGPWKIFDVSNAGAIITGKVVPLNAAGRLYTEWFGAVGDGVTDDTTPLQLTAKLAADSGYIGIQLLAKTYLVSTTVFAGGANVQSFFAPSWFGVEKRKTTISYAGISSGSAAFKFRGGTGGLCGATVNDIGFSGNANSLGIMFAGQCGMRAVRCLFDTNAEGIQWHNEDALSFTEYCVADDCEFTTACTTKGHYKVTSGNNSFNGSGLLNRCKINQSGGNILQIDSGARPYNAPFDAQIWTSTPSTLFLNNSASGTPINFHGTITVESISSSLLTLGAGTQLQTLFAGKMVLGNEVGVVAGTLVQCETAVSNLDGSVTPLSPRQSYKKAMTTGANTLTSLFSGQHRIIYVRFTAANYDYRYALDVDHDGFGSAGYVTTLATIKQLNVAAYGAPTFSVDTNGNLIATNAGFPASGVTAVFSEYGIAPGAAGSVSQQV